MRVRSNHLPITRAVAGRTMPDQLRRSTKAFAGLTAAVASLTACHDVAGTQALPAGTADPTSYNSVNGAMGQRNAAMVTWNTALRAMIINTGALTDELTTPVCSGGLCAAPLDQRILPAEKTTFTTNSSSTAASDADYVVLHQVRGLTAQAIGQLVTYDPAAPSALRGELYAVAGYAEILLADLFCSGVPLSTLNFQHDFTYASSSTTAQVYQDAVAKFDTALTLASDSSQILNLARVGKGRALLNLGAYAEAAQAVAGVPDQFQYQVTVRWNDSTLSFYDVLSRDLLQEADGEGGNGLPFASSHDPRTMAEIAVGINPTTLEPTKVTRTLSAAGFVPITVADGTEARLIQAEAALHGVATGTGSWLDQLNHLRANAIVQGLGVSAPDQLPPLAMPTTDSARIALLFQERAEWLYLTAHRQGDLRRLLRLYPTIFRSQAQVYPIGEYRTGGLYGTDITAPIPSTEYANPLFHGCINRNA